MRKANSLKNIITGVGGQVLTLILQFISRTVFIYILGVEYLGLSSLFTNVLQVLSVAELGIGTAIMYSLYKPLASGEEKKVVIVVRFLKKAYLIVGLIIIILGLLTFPLLPKLINDISLDININLIFGLYLIQTVSSYFFFAYKSLILQADQKNYIVNYIRYITMFVTVVTQIFVLVFFKSFILYLVMGIVSQIVINLMVSRKVDYLYPFLKKSVTEKMDKEEKKSLFKNLFGVSLYKINSVIVRSTDNILISSFISTVTVGIYSNYYLIITTFISLVKIFISSFTASIGNLFINGSEEKNHFVFKCLSFVSFWLYGFIAVSLWIMFNPLISLWLGPEYMLGGIVVLIIVIDFMMDGYQQVVISYKDARGLFWQGKFRPVVTAILNVIISLYLVRDFGIAGVLLGTIFSRLLTTWWFEPWLVHKYAFNMSPVKYFVRYFSFFALFSGIGFGLHLITTPLSEFTLTNFLLKLIICVIVPNIIMILIFHKSKEYIFIKQSLLSIFLKKKF